MLPSRPRKGRKLYGIPRGRSEKYVEQTHPESMVYLVDAVEESLVGVLVGKVDLRRPNEADQEVRINVVDFVVSVRVGRSKLRQIARLRVAVAPRYPQELSVLDRQVVLAAGGVHHPVDRAPYARRVVRDETRI